MYITCEEYYENYLGDWCNNKCEDCFADKEIYICKENFEVTGNTLLDKVVIEKGSWWWKVYENKTHVALTCDGKHRLHIIREIFEKHFEL